MDPADLLARREAEVLDEHPDPVVAELEKCKHYPHLRLITEAGPAHTPSQTVVRYVATLACRNETGYHGWGALLSPGHKTTGMHLFPDAVEGLVHDLPLMAEVARAAGVGVALQHTVKQKWVTWRLLDADSADQVARELRTLIPT